MLLRLCDFRSFFICVFSWTFTIVGTRAVLTNLTCALIIQTVKSMTAMEKARRGKSSRFTSLEPWPGTYNHHRRVTLSVPLTLLSESPDNPADVASEYEALMALEFTLAIDRLIVLPGIYYRISCIVCVLENLRTDFTHHFWLIGEEYCVLNLEYVAGLSLSLSTRGGKSMVKFPLQGLMVCGVLRWKCSELPRYLF